MNNKGGGSSIISSSGATTDLIDAKLEEQQQLSGSKHHCPGCGHKLEGSQPDWVGLPAGVKFDPTDQELIDHLEAKVDGKRTNKSHPLIDEFIPTIEGEDGICYTHPEKLPGVTRDGLSRHFFHRPSKAYTTGTRKRRKIQTECDLRGGETRWHKTGKTRPVMVSGKQKGCKKILVLYTNFGKNRKPEKTNWVMHQYHLGQLEEEKEGELVVSKIFYQTQPRQCNWSSERAAAAAAAAAATSGTTTSAGDGSTEPSGSGGGAGGGGGGVVSSKEVVLMGRSDPQHEIMIGMPSYSTAMEIHQQQFKSHDNFGFASAYRKGFEHDQGGGGDGEASSTAIGGGGACSSRPDVAVTAASMSAVGMCEDQGIPHHHIPPHQQDPHHHHPINAVTSYHHMISRPANSISEMISPPPLHQASLILSDHNHPYHLPRMIFPTENFQHQQQQHTQQQIHQQQQQHHHHHKIVGRSSGGSGLEEIIMGCTSSSSAADIKEESSMANPQEAEWLKYSSFWPDPDNPDDHHG